MEKDDSDEAITLCFKCKRLKTPGTMSPEDPYVVPLKNSKKGHMGMAGSFEESLLKGRTSIAPSEAVPFTAKIGVTSKSSDRHFRPLKLNFGAVYYSMDSHHLEDVSSPYVGTLDLERHYIQKEEDKVPPWDSFERRFPGYKIPKCGTLQIVILNKEQTVCHISLFSYDISHLAKDRKVIIRKSTFSDPLKKHLVSTMQFEAVHVRNKGFYIFGDVKLIFRNRVVDSVTESMNCVGTNVEVHYAGTFKMDVDRYIYRCGNCFPRSDLEAFRTENSRRQVHRGVFEAVDSKCCAGYSVC